MMRDNLGYISSRIASILFTLSGKTTVIGECLRTPFYGHNGLEITDLSVIYCLIWQDLLLMEDELEVKEMQFVN